MSHTPQEYLSRHDGLTAAAQRTGRWYARYCLGLTGLYAVMVVAGGLLPLPQPAPLLLAAAGYVIGLTVLTVWQQRRRGSWPRYLTPVHLTVVGSLTLVNTVAVVGGTGLLGPAGGPLPWFAGAVVAALVVGGGAALWVRRLSASHAGGGTARG